MLKSSFSLAVYSLVGQFRVTKSVSIKWFKKSITLQNLIIQICSGKLIFLESLLNSYTVDRFFR